jgi:hypothetical protein
VSDDHNTTDWDLIMSIRGGFPENCDFCEQPYGKNRHPVPESASVVSTFSGSNLYRPELWNDAHWRWFEDKYP